MADQESQPPRAPSRAEQRMAAVAKLRRAASLPRMKDGRRPPMHVEAVSEGEKPPSDEDRVESEEEKAQTEAGQGEGVEPELMDAADPSHGTQEPFVDPLPVFAIQTPADNEVDAENPDTELEERPVSPGPTKKRRSRSRSRSRGSKDLKGKFKLPSSPMPQLGGDSSQDETLPLPSPMLLPISPIPSPVPHLPFLQPPRLLRSPAPLSPDMSMFYPGPSPPTPLPTLEDLQKGLMRSNSVGTAAAGRRLALHKLTGGTESYDPSPSPTPPPFRSKLSRNNTLAGGERIAARENMLNRIGTRMTREADAEAASGTEDRGLPSPTPKRRKRRSRHKGSVINMNVNPGVSDSDFPSTDTNTPAFPSSPPPALHDLLAGVRTHSTTPNQTSSSRTHSSERVAVPTPPPIPSIIHPTKEEQERPEHHRRRSVVIEDPDDDDQNDSPSILHQQYPPLPGTPHRNPLAIEALRTLGSNTPSNASSSDSAPTSAVAVPLFYNPRAPSRNEPFPTSPFTTPLKERPLSEDDEEQVLYPAAVRPRTPYGNAFETLDREISWVASPVPEFRMPIRDDEEESELNNGTHLRNHDGRVLELEIPEEEEEEEEEIPPSASADSSHSFSPEVFNDMSPRVSASSKSVLVESEISPEHVSSLLLSVTPSSTTPLSQPPAVVRVEETASPQFYPQRLSVASRIQSVGDRSTIGLEFADLDNHTGADSPKRAETSTASAWEKVKNTLARAGSSSGRRSRTNSIVTRERRDNTDSSVSRESGGSLAINRIDSNQPQAPPLMQTPSASASILSLAPPLGPPRLNASPIPPASPADLSKYQNAKLFPFPGIVKLKEERLAKGYQYTPSTPDVSQYDEFHVPSMAYSFSGSSSQTVDPGEQKLSHQNSDTRLTNSVPELITAQTSVQEYIDVSSSNSQNGGSYKLPMTLPGVKQWLSKNSRKKGSQTQNIPGPVVVSVAPGVDTGIPMTSKRPSLSDIFSKRPSDLGDWEEQPTTPDVNKYIGNGNTLNGIKPDNTYDLNHSSPVQPSVTFDSPPLREAPPKDPSPPSRLTIATPDPSSVSDYPAPTPSESSITSSCSSLHGRQGSLVLERLEENLSHSRSPMWSAAVDDPPRKLVLSSPVLQVVNQNTVKDRFLLLFTDILIVAKPVTPDPHDSLTDPFKLTMPDKKYTVKHVVQLQKLRFCGDRMEGLKSPSLGSRNPLIRTFVSEFAIDPDRAVASLFLKSKREADSASLGQLLFKTLDLDRSRLGEYLSRRSSKSVLKSYLDSFGFAGLRVDVALRVFLHSINLSQYTHSHGALEYLLDSFASRWYEANAKFVPYDKDMALQLAWALAQLNDRLHGAIADEPGITDPSLRPVSIREFQDAFRRYDPRCLISEDLLQELYRSISYERLCQAGPSIMSSREIPVTIKRPIPSRLTYKAQSEPIVFRLPQPDPLITIELYGQDLIFDPPILHFTRSSEASFRVTGTSLGLKTITMCRSGPNAIKYSGLPLSHSIIVERAFMRNTFQIAFLTSTGAKRRYMFSVDDPIIRNEWVTCLRRQIDASNTTAAALKLASSFGSSKFHRAAQSVAFEVLQEKLIGSGTSLLRSSLTNGNSIPPLIGSSAPFSLTTIHTRSKSRSRIYNHGAGRDERELNRLENCSNYSNDSSNNVNIPEQQLGGNIWTSRDLEMYCLQNSSISLVLSFLQVGAPEHVAS